ncbi:hypothetical protein Ndes2526B_g01461 [Nannochloris sp. 'desiccata']
MGIAWRAVPTSGATISPVAAVASAPSHLLRRWQSSPGADATQQVQESMDKINDLFVEAREEIAYAQEDAGTTYFNDSYDDAKGLVDKVLEQWDTLLSGLEENERGKVQRSMGLKMEQLKAELQQLDTLHD